MAWNEDRGCGGRICGEAVWIMRGMRECLDGMGGGMNNG